ncbi:hypothetical protein CNMCM5793_000310 [Aspergillus hiratsukae]|uniref:Ig-like domain-containing protein n=1 Tax=Aspergillus hiratsukae TaxID=1194566 RepID=A0A8H6QB88_9EURO|nr:hypothetical protein CNMCM5793_000310 [Aspergillus hiratsukae]KAF7168876.1 hypothetical protein CNMCM6106_003891 [Aspergillus hiratsukae]
MTDTLANASKLKPEIRLARAVSAFKAVLTAEHKGTFDTSILNLQYHPPNATEAMLWPPFYERLASSATMLSQGASYLEKMSLLFMQAGRNAPRYEDMALLYPRSKRLQDGFCEYFIVVVNLCQHAVEFIQKSTISRMMLAMTDSSLSSFEKDLQQWSVFIMEEVALLSGQSAEEEAKENSRFRKVMVRFSTFNEHQRKLARKIRLLDTCSTYDYQTPWKQARKQGTTTWFASNAEYQTWREQISSSSMLCIGKLGSGKTTLIANMVDDLIRLAPSGSVAYFFCRYDVSESLTARTILGCLARQLLGQQPVDLTNVEWFFYDPLAHRDEQFILPTAPVYILVLDGLYECPESEQQTTIELLHQLQQHFKILICLSFRKDTENHVKTLTIPENNPDIEAYIDAELRERLESDRLCVGDPAIILSIQHALVTGAQGMFLWASLLLDCICVEQTDEGILQALDSLPQSLSETFTRVLQQAIKELCEALSVVAGDTKWESARQINNIHAALSSRKCLIIIDEEEQTVRFAHHSVKQYFIAQGDEPGNTNPINPDEANKEMGRIILTYLNYGIFDRQLRITGWLQYELQRRRVTGLDGDFIPVDALNQLFRYNVVRKALEESRFDEREVAQLSGDICMRHLQWFAILIDIGLADCIRDTFQAWPKDRDLPISRVQFLEKFKSKISQTTVPPTVGLMETDRWEKLAELFCLRQREYLVPILKEGQHYDSNGVMPFLRIENPICNYDNESLLVIGHSAHYTNPPAYRGAEKVDGGYRIALRSLHRYEIGPEDQFLISRGDPITDPFHLLQAVASYRPRGQGGTVQPIHLVFPLSGANLDDVWRQSLVTGRVQPLLRWSLAQMAGLAKALAFVIRKNREERGIVSLRQITPRNIQWFKHLTIHSYGWGTLHLDLRPMIVPSEAPVGAFEVAYRAAYEVPVWGTMTDDAEGRCVWSLGCICFEFLIWAVMGTTYLQRFREARGGANAPFHSKIVLDASKLGDSSRSDHYEAFELSPEVCRWGRKLEGGSELQLPVRHLIKYLLAMVLAVNPADRVSAGELASDLGKFVSADLNTEQPEPEMDV